MSSHRHVLALLAALLLPSLAAPAPRTNLTAPDTQDVILLGHQRPLRLRLHIFVADRPYSARWSDFLCKLFAVLDRNEDGVLDEVERGRSPSPLQLLHAFRGVPFFNDSVGAVRPFGDMDSNHDGVIALDEFVAYYRLGAGPLQLESYFVNDLNPDPLSERLFEVLDSDRDRRLSRKELAAAATELGKLDGDDDEMVTPQELLAGSIYASRRVDIRRTRFDPHAPTLLLVRQTSTGQRMSEPVRIARELLQYYDRDHNQKLSRTELALPRATFDGLDTNRDGQLSAEELLRWSTLPAEAEVLLRLSDPKAGPTVEIIGHKGATGAPNAALRDRSRAVIDRSLCVTLMEAPAMTGSVSNYRALLHQQLRVLDRDRKGFVTRKQLGGPSSFYLRGVLDLIDHEDNGQLTPRKIDAWLELMTAATTCSVSLTLVPVGNSLFQALDADGDGRLSVREQRSAWERVAGHVEAGSSGLGRHDLPQQYRLVANLGGPNYAAYSQIVNQQVGRFPNPLAGSSQAGPLWFRKMDRNRDGDVSLREFLGTVEQFRRLDRDGDGLISLHEAEQAGSRLPTKKAGR